MQTEPDTVKYMYSYLLSHSSLHIDRTPLVQFVPLMGLVLIPFSWRAGAGGLLLDEYFSLAMLL